LSKKFLKLFALVAILALGAGAAWALDEITSGTLKGTWKTDTSTDSITPSDGSDAAGFSVSEKAGDFTFVAGNGLEFQKSISVDVHLVSSDVPNNPLHAASGPFKMPPIQ
jgi:hypothetical protein